MPVPTLTAFTGDAPNSSTMSKAQYSAAADAWWPQAQRNREEEIAWREWEISTAASRVEAILESVNNAQLNDAINALRFPSDQLKVGKPDINDINSIARIDGIMTGLIQNDGGGFGDIGNYTPLGSQANNWIHIPFSAASDAEIISFNLTIVPLLANTEKFWCNNYFTANRNDLSSAENASRFKAWYVAATNKYYLSFKLLSSNYASFKIDAMQGALGTTLIKNQFGTPEVSLSSTPSV